jgi:hypothetical protein
MLGNQIKELLHQQLVEWWFRTRNMIDGNEFITVAGGDQHRSDGQFSTILGGLMAKANLYGQVVHAAGSFSTVGDAQHGILIAWNETTDNSVTKLSLDGPTATKLLLLKTETAWGFHGLLTGIRVGGAGQAAGLWNLRGLIRRDTTAASTAIVASSVTQWALDAGLTWGAPTLAADTTNGALAIAVRGTNGEQVRWVAVLDYVDIGSSA